MTQNLNGAERCTVFASVFVAVFLLVCTGMGTVTAQSAPTEEFNKTYGGADTEEGGSVLEGVDDAESVVETSDGGFALAGGSYSFGAGSQDAWLIKTDSNGNVEFNKTYGGILFDTAEAVIETSDGGFALAGRSESFGGLSKNAWLMKTDSNGNVEFQKTYNSGNIDIAVSVVETSDGGFALAGGTMSDTSKNNDAWLIKTDSDGNVEFNRTYGGATFDTAMSMVETSDGGFALGGQTMSFDDTGDEFVSDAWLIKTDSDGNEEFNRTYGGADSDSAESIVETSDGGFALAGKTESFSGGFSDLWLIKTDSNGNEQFNKTYGGPKSDFARSMVETSDNGFALAGYTQSFSTGGSFDEDAWLIKTDSDGNVEFNSTYGGTEEDGAKSVIKTSDSGFALAGQTNSFGAEDFDAWLIKLSGVDFPVSIDSLDTTQPDGGFEFMVEMTESSVGEVAVESDDFGVELSVVDDAGDNIGAQTETSVEFIDIDKETSTYTLRVNVTGGAEGDTGTITAATGGNIGDSGVEAQNSMTFTLVDVSSPVKGVSDALWTAVTQNDGENGLSLADLGNAIQAYQANPSDADIDGVSIGLSDLGSLIQFYQNEVV